MCYGNIFSQWGQIINRIILKRKVSEIDSDRKEISIIPKQLINDKVIIDKNEKKNEKLTQ